MDLRSHDSIAVVRFDESETYPRLTRATLREFDALLAAIAREGIFRGVVLAANENSFAVGADLEEIAEFEPLEARAFALESQRVLDAVEQFPIPVVAAIRGFCLGGGLDLALACPARVATYEASFAHPGATLGLVTGWGGTQRLPRLIGRAAAMQMLLTGERIPATQALSLRLVNELVSSKDLIEAAARLAALLAERRKAAPTFPDSPQSA